MNNSYAKGGDIAQQKAGELHYVEEKRRVRLEEFVTAFLGFSTFEIADVWAPVTDASGMTTLHNVFTVNSEQTDGLRNVALFRSFSKSTIIKPWSGAVGRAHSTGTPVWSTNPVRSIFCLAEPFLSIHKWKTKFYCQWFTLGTCHRQRTEECILHSKY